MLDSLQEKEEKRLHRALVNQLAKPKRETTFLNGEFKSGKK